MQRCELPLGIAEGGAQTGDVFEPELDAERFEREEAVDGIREGLADAAGGRMQPLGEAFADLRQDLGLNERA